jgi:hypothetical protein
LFSSAASPAFAAEPPRDPPPATDEIRFKIPREELTGANISVQFDWIKLPHLAANELLRKKLRHSTEGDPLYKALQEMIAQKKAERLDLNTLVVRHGQRAKGRPSWKKPIRRNSIRHRSSTRCRPGAEAKDFLIPVTPSSFTTKNTGHYD